MTAHLCVAGGLFAAAVWNLERLQADKLHVEIRDVLPLPAAAGRLASQTTKVDFKPKVHITKDTVQPTERKPKETPQAPSTGEPTTGGGGGAGDASSPGQCTENCDPTPRAPVCGDGSLDAGEQCDDGNTLDGDGCSSTCRIEARPQPPAMVVVPPHVLQGLRVSGDTQVRPSEGTQQQMVHDGVSRALGVVKLCIAADGGVSSANLLRSTKYPDYDQRLVAAVQGWRYQPYSVNGIATRACSTVTFIYQIQ